MFQCYDTNNNNDLSPDDYNGLEIPCAVEYISLYTLSIQSAYLATAESMLSAKHYMKTTFISIDSSTNTVLSNILEEAGAILQSIQFLLNGLQEDKDREIQEQLNSIEFMTSNYYMKRNIEVTNTEQVQIGDAEDMNDAKAIIFGRQCTSLYTQYMNDVDTVKMNYKNKMSNINYSNINNEDWKNIVNSYYESREEIIEKSSNVYASIKNAFMYSYDNQINLCTESINIDKKQLVSN